MIILVDLDDVLADLERGFFEKWRARFPNLEYILPQNRTIYDMKKQYPAEYNPLIETVLSEEGFYRELPPMVDGINAIVEMDEEGHNVFIVTSPLKNYQNCVNEKYDWVDQYLGSDWVRKIILTADKTVVHGNYLIDDKPEITGKMAPVWEHIIYDTPYNRHITDKKRLTWQNWREVLPL